MFAPDTGLFSNRILWTSILAWAIAQTLKVFTCIWAEGKPDWSKIVGPGGMPSSHSAFVTSIAVGVGIQEGWNSALFAVTVGFALVVMYDAAGIRRAAGEHAQVLNQLIERAFREGYLESTKLRELLGHTPLEVAMGAFLGIVVSWLMIGWALKG
ncbi:MAG: divergent PAP2 family protein [Bacillota bacterium]|jgi:acid phosphatase family membrane protein YuiD|nr:divergent PAP2 family protein [Bacillota bacterium]HOK70544.1 divergent PAP2 family protein [Bacillota bacterium]HOL50768.1 divergent PAP2 family protein [Bacillota bacterium]HOO30535.1 divergent PAP2 family protein [Bacillota bacterium]HPQ03322.1 divergent PAP2 family protein [Bacillota bacterium]